MPQKSLPEPCSTCKERANSIKDQIRDFAPTWIVVVEVTSASGDEEATIRREWKSQALTSALLHSHQPLNKNGKRVRAQKEGLKGGTEVGAVTWPSQPGEVLFSGCCRKHANGQDTSQLRTSG